MSWAMIAVTFIFGCLFGFTAKTVLSRKDENQQDLQATERVKLEFSQYKQEVTDQFILHHRQLFQLTEQINRLNKNWNETASILQTDHEAKTLPQLTSETISVPLHKLDESSSEAKVIDEHKAA